MTNRPIASKERKTSFRTISELEVKTVYDPGDVTAQNQPGFPGEYPFVRGIRESMYRGKLWTMRQYAGYGSAEEANRRYKYLLEQGTTGLSIAFDLPTQMGRDSDHILAKGEVGRVGVAISTIEDMEILLKEIPLEKVSISMTINATASILLAFLLVAAERRKVSWSSLQGTIQNDILKEYIARGTYIFPPKHALRIVTDIFAFCRGNVEKWNTISISGYHIREAGSTAVQELGFTFSNAVAYVEAALKAGLEIDDFAPRLAFFFNCHNDFFEEIAKFRAARRLWAKLMRERFKAQNPDSMMLRFHTQTAGSSLTAQQPLNNVVRTSLQALAAVLGGTQSLHTNSFDEALGLPTETSAKIALRTQQLIADESGVADTIDPLGGSYLVENWTERLEKEALSEIEKIDKMGGMLAAIDKNYPQSEIEKAAYIYQRQIENKERIIVGVNDFIDQDEVVPDAQMLDPKNELEQCQRLGKYRAQRNKGRFTKAIARLKEGLKGSENLMPLIIDCVRADATLGEISDALRAEMGEYHGTGLGIR